MSEAMNDIHVLLTSIWFGLLGFVIVMYVLLDGFDLGIGVLTLLGKKPVVLKQMVSPLTGIWDANETWLILAGGILFGAFPLAYATILHALYIPVMLLLFGLILRGIGLEYSHHSQHPRFWLALFGWGSLLATLAQGFILGGVLSGLSVKENTLQGMTLNWLTPFTIMTSIGVVLGYALLGASFLLIKTKGSLKIQAIHWANGAAVGMLVALCAILLWTPTLYPHIAIRWLEYPTRIWLIVFFVLGLTASIGLFYSLNHKAKYAPFAWSLLIFLLSFIGLAISLYPDWTPNQFSIIETASSSETLIFMLLGIGMLIPIMLVYNGFQYLVFSDKNNPDNLPNTKKLTQLPDLR